MPTTYFLSTPDQKKALAQRIVQGDSTLVDALLRRAPLHAAMARGDIELGKALVEGGAIVNARRQGNGDPRGLTPLDDAISLGKEEAAEWIRGVGGLRAAQMPPPALATGADAGAPLPIERSIQGPVAGEVGLDEAPRPKKAAGEVAKLVSQDQELLGMLLDEHPVHAAVQAGSIQSVKIFVAMKARLDDAQARADSSPRTALDLAMELGHGEIAKILFKAGAKTGLEVAASRAKAAAMAAFAMSAASSTPVEAVAPGPIARARAPSMEAEPAPGAVRAPAEPAPAERAPSIEEVGMKVAAKRAAARPEWSGRDEAFWTGDAKKFKELNRGSREARSASGAAPSELDAACDMGDAPKIRELLSAKHEALGMKAGSPKM